MAGARRAAGVADDGEVAEVLLVTSARRAVPAQRGATLRRILAPVTLLAVAGLAVAATVLPGTGAGLELTDPSMASSSAFGVSRNFARSPLPPAVVSTAPSAPASSSPSATESPSATASASASASPSASASASANASPSATTVAVTPTPVDYTALSATAGTRYTSDNVNLRVGPGVGYDARTTLGEGKAVEITEWSVDGWRQVVWSEKSGWIKESFLTADKPVAQVATAAASSESGSSTFSNDACAAASGIESGLTSRTRAVLRAVCAEFPAVTSYGGYRAGGGSYHSSGQAIDVMVSGEAGWEIARWARANASALGIIEVLYSQQIWTAQRSGDGWRGMEDRGSVSANHYDHVHISVG